MQQSIFFLTFEGSRRNYLCVPKAAAHCATHDAASDLIYKLSDVVSKETLKETSVQSQPDGVELILPPESFKGHKKKGFRSCLS